MMLNFCGAQDNYDLFIDPVGDVFLETDGTTIWLLKDDKRHETNNMPGYINLLLEEIYRKTTLEGSTFQRFQKE